MDSEREQNFGGEVQARGGKVQACAASSTWRLRQVIAGAGQTLCCTSCVEAIIAWSALVKKQDKGQRVMHHVLRVTCQVGCIIACVNICVKLYSQLLTL